MGRVIIRVPEESGAIANILDRLRSVEIELTGVIEALDGQEDDIQDILDSISAITDDIVSIQEMLNFSELDRKPPSAGDLFLGEDELGEKFSTGAVDIVTSGIGELEEIDQLTQEDKIPVQTSQGSGVIDFPELIFQRQKLVYTKDFMPFECQETVEGSASIYQGISNLNYMKMIQTGEQSDSRARLSNPLRHGLFRLPEENGRQKIDFTKRIQFIQHVGMLEWAEGSEIICSFGRGFSADSDSGQRMFGFVIKGATPTLHLMANDGQGLPAEAVADTVPFGKGVFVSTICMDFYPGEAFVLTLNGVEYELTSQLPTGVRVNALPGIWDMTNGANDEDIRFEIYRNEVTVIP